MNRHAFCISIYNKVLSPLGKVENHIFKLCNLLIINSWFLQKCLFQVGSGIQVSQVI